MQRIAAYDPDGFYLAAMDPACAERAIARREAARIPGGIALRPSAAKPIRELTPEEKRRIVLARERSKR